MNRIFKFFDGWFGRAASLYGLWPIVPTALITAITFLVTSTTAYIEGLGPFGWWSVALGTGIATYVIIVVCGWMTEKTRERRAKRQIIEKLASVSSFNPLEPRFFKKRLSLYDFTDPFGHALKNKIFEECELIGPSTIVVLCEYARNNHHNVEFAKIADDKIHQIPNKIILDGGAIRDCKIANVLFLVPNSMVATFEKGFSGQMPWIN